MSFDFESLRLKDGEQSLATMRRRFPRSNAMRGQFVRPLPLAWILAALRLGGAALPVAILLGWQAGIHRCSTNLMVPSTALTLFGIARHPYYRALAQLEGAGLIMVNRRPGCKARITLTQWK